MNRYLEKVGEIRSYMSIPPSDSQRQKFLNKLPQDSRRHYDNSIDNLIDSISEQEGNEDWYIMNNRMQSDNFMTLKSKHPHGVAVYMMAFKNPEGTTEVGFTMRKPKPVQWIEQAKSRVQEEQDSKVNTKNESSEIKNSQNNRSSDTEIDREIDDIHKSDKHTSKDKRNYSSRNTARINSDIDKDNLIVLLSARISNVLHATKKKQDFRQIINYYDELENILKDIYDIESLKENEHRLPCELNTNDIEKIKAQAVIIEENNMDRNQRQDDTEPSDREFSAFEMN